MIIKPAQFAVLHLPRRRKGTLFFSLAIFIYPKENPGDVYHPSKLKQLKGQAIRLIENDYSQDRLQKF